jgi:hypothetical protein
MSARRVNGSDLKRKVVRCQIGTGSTLSMKRQQNSTAERSSRFVGAKDGLRWPPPRNARILVLPAVMTEYKQKAKADHEKQEARLEVHTTLKKVIPGPDVLRQRHGNQLDSSEHKQKAAEVFGSAGQQ